jgi:hypothetical protein
MAFASDDHEHVFRFMTPLLPDGTFELRALPKSELLAAVATWNGDMSNNVNFHLVPRGGDVERLELAVASGDGRTLDVIARSTVASALDGAEVIMLPGRHAFKTLAELFARRDHAPLQVHYARAIVGEQVPDAARAKTRPGDLVAHFDDANTGEVTACVIGYMGDLVDPATWRKIEVHGSELEVRCATAGPDDHVVVVEAPPQKRFD